MAQPQLSPDMAQPAMDQFLAAAFGIQASPFSVKDIFESRKDPVAWGLLQRTLKLDDKQAHDLVLSHARAMSHMMSDASDRTTRAPGTQAYDLYRGWPYSPEAARVAS